jgi:hypothetical protein
MNMTRSPWRLAALAAPVLSLAGAALAESAAKNWTPPAYKIYAQVLAERTMAQHPELLSVTLHGTPPGLDKVYTMFAGSYPERVGNPDDPDDIDVINKGITIVDPRWRKAHDTVRKFVVQEPLRDRSGQNVGLIVYAFKADGPARSELDYTRDAMAMRDALAADVPSYPALFEAAR